jgi:CheY-like chemotaxis protein
MLPFFSARGYVIEAADNGRDALAALTREARHLVVVELDLGDMLLADFMEPVFMQGRAGAMVLLDDPSRSGLIVSALARGVDSYVPTPPDEHSLFRAVERHLLAQWALAQPAEDARILETHLVREQHTARIKELEHELASLRQRLASTPHPPQRPPARTAPDDAARDFDEATVSSPLGGGSITGAPFRSVELSDRTAPIKQVQAPGAKERKVTSRPHVKAPPSDDDVAEQVTEEFQAAALRRPVPRGASGTPAQTTHSTAHTPPMSRANKAPTSPPSRSPATKTVGNVTPSTESDPFDESTAAIGPPTAPAFPHDQPKKPGRR